MCKLYWKSTQIAVFVRPTLDNGWSCWQHIIVGVLTLAQHWSKSRFNSRSTDVGPTSVLQLSTNGGFGVVGPMMAEHILADCNRVIFLSMRVILIMQKSYNLFFHEHFIILFYKNNISIYLVIVSDINNLKLGEFLAWIRCVDLLNMNLIHFIYSSHSIL